MSSEIPARAFTERAFNTFSSTRPLSGGSSAKPTWLIFPMDVPHAAAFDLAVSRLPAAQLGAEARVSAVNRSDAARSFFYNWRTKLRGLSPSEVRRIKQLEEEHPKLKRLVVDLSLDKAMLQDVLAKKSLKPSGCVHLQRI
jgi:hypothetical protein